MTTDRISVAVFVGTRADLGPLGPVLEALRECADIDLTVLTGVAFGADELAARLPDRPMGGPPWRVVGLAAPVAGAVEAAAVLEHGARLGAGAARWMLDSRPDVLVVLGDRWELLHVVPPAVLAGVRVVHLHGGEVTEGAVDDRVRHAVTKLADQHCVASEDAARRVLGLGEPAARVHVTGAPGLDRLVGLSRPGEEALAAAIGRPVVRPVALFTYHPPTAVESAPLRDWAAGALAATIDRCGTVVVTHPGLDPGREEILAAIAEVVDDDRVVVRESLGRDYPLVLSGVDVVVGNSSSGIIEAASVGVPAVDVGDRQRGRLRGPGVVHADEGRVAVGAALDAVLGLGPGHAARPPLPAANPYGDGHAAAAVVDVVRSAPAAPRAKGFVDRTEATR